MEAEPMTRDKIKSFVVREDSDKVVYEDFISLFHLESAVAWLNERIDYLYSRDSITDIQRIRIKFKISEAFPIAKEEEEND